MSRGRTCRTPDQTEAAFWDRVEKTDACWLWTGALNGNGYGVMTVAGKATGAHRFSFMLAGGATSPASPFVLHSCDVRHCVNPAHLRAGDRADNGRDYSLRIIAGGSPGARAGEEEFARARPPRIPHKVAADRRGAASLRGRQRRLADEASMADADREAVMARLAAALDPMPVETLCRAVMGQCDAPVPVDDVAAYLVRKVTLTRRATDPFEKALRRLCTIALGVYDARKAAA